MKKIYNKITNLVNEQVHDTHGAVVPPIYQTSLFTFNDWDAADEAFSNKKDNFIYSRGSNPTVRVVEDKIANLAGGDRALLFSSGMAAISSAILSCIKSGSHIIAVNNVYGPTNNFLQNYLKNKSNVEVTYVLGDKVSEFEEAIREETDLIYLESPSSVVFGLQDIAEVTKLAKANGIKTIIDNTWATPIFQQPLAMGVDLEVHSCSKYIGGHSDVISGVVIGNEELIQHIFSYEYELLGAKMAPFEAWLLLRSLRTLPIRMQQHQLNGLEVATFLEGHSFVKKVHYPGLASSSQYELGKKQMTGYTGVLSFIIDTDNVETIKVFVNTLKLFKLGVSWGGHESLVYVPAISYLKEMTTLQFTQLGISLGDIRLSIGLEDVEDLIDDLKSAFNTAQISNEK